MTQLEAVNERSELPKKQEKQRYFIPDGLQVANKNLPALATDAVERRCRFMPASTLCLLVQETNTLIAARSSFNLGGSLGRLRTSASLGASAPKL